MKKVLSLFLAFVFVMSMCAAAPITANAASLNDLTFELNEDGKSYYVSDCSYETTGEVIIPESYNGLPVTKIGDKAFFNTPHITSVQMPSTVTIIGESAFYECAEIETITGYENVFEIGKSAFQGCRKLKTPIFPEKVSTVGESVFAYCRSFESIEIPEYITSIGDSAFYECIKAKTIKLHDGINSIGIFAFANCISLTEISLPADLTKISESLFATCISLEKIKIPRSVKTIEREAFSGCEALVEIEIPEEVKAIEPYTFINCRNLESIVIPEGATKILECAFASCESLKEITIPSTLKEIGEDAFYNCCLLEKVHINDLGKWCSIDFSSKDSNPLSCGAQLYEDSKLLKDLVIPEGVTDIKKYAFYSEFFIDSIQFPKTLRSIGEDAFFGTNIEEVFISDFVAWCNITFDSTPMNRLSKLYLDNEVISGDFVVPDGATKIPAYTFANSKISTVVIPEGVIEIGEEAFRGSEITSIVIPDSVVSIGERTFEYCKSLKNVTIGKGVKTIGFLAFDYCNVLENVYISDLKAWCSIEFKPYNEIFGNKNLSSNPLHYAENLYLNNKKVLDLVIPEGVSKINEYAFLGCDSIVSVSIPSNTTKNIGEKSFSSCVNLEKVTIGDGVTAIGDNAFSSCNKLNMVSLGKKVDSIGEYAFVSRTTKLEYIYIPENVKSIGTKAFGFFNDGSAELVKIENFKISGRKGSVAEKYAKDNSFTFIEDGKAITLSTPTVTIKNTAKGIEVNWNAIENAESYIVYRSVLSGSNWSKWSAIKKGVTTTSYVDTTVKLGTKYKYTVRAVNGDKMSKYVGTTGSTYNVTPTVKVAVASNGIKVSWSTVANATGYTVYKSEYNSKTKKWSNWKTMGTVKASKTSWTDKSVKSGTHYKYTIRAVNGKVLSSYNKTGAATLYLAQPTVKIANASTGVKVSWSKVTGATGYTVYRSEYKNGAWTKWASRGTAKANKTSWTDTKVASGVQYKYTVRAINGSVKSTYVSSNTVLYLAQPKTTVKAVSNGINVAWTQSTGATGYTVYRMEYNAKTKKWSGWKKMGTAKSSKTNWTDKSAKKGVQYKYTVKAVNGKTASTYKASSSVKR